MIAKHEIESWKRHIRATNLNPFEWKNGKLTLNGRNVEWVVVEHNGKPHISVMIRESGYHTAKRLPLENQSTHFRDNILEDADLRRALAMQMESELAAALIEAKKSGTADIEEKR